MAGSDPRGTRRSTRAPGRLRGSRRLGHALGLVSLAGLGIAASCDLTESPPRSASLLLSPAVLELDALDAVRIMNPLLRDDTGNRVQGAPLEWSSDDPAVARVEAGGQVRAVANGQTVVRARLGEMEATAVVRVEQVPRRVHILTGGVQRAAAGVVLPDSIRLQVTDRLGHPVPGTRLSLAPSDGGAVEPAAVEADGEGHASVRWTLGPVPGTQHLFVAIDPRHRAALVADAEDSQGRVPFRIQYRLLTEAPDAVVEALDQAILRWERAIAGKLAPVRVRVGAGSCGDNAPALDEVVDDLTVLVTVETMDGPGGVVARANPCLLREDGLLPLMGQLRLDASDLEALEAVDLLQDVVAHEIGHVLGIGSLWELFELLRLPSLPDNRGADTHFEGPEAIQAFDRVGGEDYAGAKVPVENDLAGEGTRDRHWRQSIMGHELLTGLLDPAGPNPLSRVSVASLGDLGYEVDLDTTEPYDLQTAVEQEEGFELIHPVERDPIRVVTTDGRIVTVLHASVVSHRCGEGPRGPARRVKAGTALLVPARGPVQREAGPHSACRPEGPLTPDFERP